MPPAASSASSARQIGVSRDVRQALALASTRMGYLDAQEGDEARTAFRKAEKKYKLYKHASTSRSLSSKHRSKVPPTDLTDVLDFSKVASISSVAGVQRLEDNYEWPVYALDFCPGFYFIPGALTVEQQLHWVKETFTSFIEPPNRTNHNALYGPISNLWSAANSQLVLVEECSFENGDLPNLQRNSLSTVQENVDERIGFPPRQPFSDPKNNNCLSVEACSSQKMNNPITGYDNSYTLGLATEVHSANLYADALCHSSQDACQTDRAMQEAAFQDSSLSNCGEPRLCSSANDKRPIAHWRFADPMINLKKDAESVNLSKMSAAEVLLQKLRWATLGLQFDWTKRAYDTLIPHKKFPVQLAALAARLALPAMVDGNFSTEAAIINFYRHDDMLGGHIDDMEADWSKPIVSISLGCKAIFLLGGVTREEPPIAIFLRSGDVVLMAGEARRRFHGVPRIFAGVDEADLPNFSAVSDDSADLPFIEYIKKTRININIRQVF